MRTVLLVDDEPNLRLLLSTTLQDPGVRLLEASTGEEALALARRELPDVMVLDWMMPRLSGVEVVRALKGDPLTAGIAVVMLTARSRPEDHEEGVAAGADAFLTKPFSPLELLEKIDELLSR